MNLCRLRGRQGIQRHGVWKIWGYGAFFAANLLLPLQASELDEALRATLMHHPSLNGKRAEIQAKGYAVDVARTQHYPSLSAQAAIQDGSQPAAIRARQPLWTFGRIESTIAYADTEVTVEQADFLRIQRQLLEQTAVAYARVVGAQQRIKVAEDNIISLDRFYQQIQRREQAQMASIADVRLAASRLMQARSQKERYLGELAVARNELTSLTQVEVKTEQSVPEQLTQLPALAELEKMAQERSADVMLKQRKVALAQADVERERKSPMPTVYLQADQALHTQQEKKTNIGLVIEGNLDGAGFAALGRGKIAGARLQAVMEDLNNTRNDIQRNVNTLFANYRLQQTLLGSQQASITELDALLASYQRQYEAGQKSWLEVLNMQRELTDQRLQQVQAENDWLINSLKLTVLTGGLDVQEEKK